MYIARCLAVFREKWNPVAFFILSSAILSSHMTSLLMRGVSSELFLAVQGTDSSSPPGTSHSSSLSPSDCSLASFSSHCLAASSRAYRNEHLAFCFQQALQSISNFAHRLIVESASTAAKTFTAFVEHDYWMIRRSQLKYVLCKGFALSNNYSLNENTLEVAASVLGRYLSHIYPGCRECSC